MTDQSVAADRQLSIDTIYGLLGDQRRRATVRVLNANDRRISVDQLITRLETRNPEDVVTESPSLENLRLSLVHVHLPKLAETDIVRFDHERRLIEPTPRLERLRAHLPDSASAENVFFSVTK